MSSPEYMSLKSKYDELNEKNEKDMEFYDKALEARTN